jgi:hypothetical protein
MTTTPPVDESVPTTTSNVMFPQWADGGGYTTQFVLFSGSANQSSVGELQLSAKSGENANLTLGQAPPAPDASAIFPSPTTVAPGGTVSFSGLLNGAASNTFNWSVAEADGGSITPAGIYTAPARMGLFHVIATSQADAGKSITALVTVAQSIQTERSIALDFTQTQFSYTIYANAALPGPMVIFKATNRSPNDTTIFFSSITCNGFTTERPIRQNSRIPTRPGDTVFFKITLEYGWCKGLPGTGNFPTGDYAVGTTEIQNVDISLSIDQPALKQTPITVTVPIRVDVSRATDIDLPPGDTQIVVLLRDASGLAASGRATVANEFGMTSASADATGKVIFNVAKAREFWLWSDNPGRRSTPIYVDGNNLQPQYTLTLTALPQWDVSAQLLASVKGKIGFWSSSVSKDKTKMLLGNGMENWSDPSLVTQSKLILLDVQSGAVLWTHDLGNQSWSTDLSDNARYAIVSTAWSSLPGIPPLFVRLLDARDGSVIWTKYLNTSEFPTECTSASGFSSNGVKFSHDGNLIFMGLEQCPYAYLLNRSDGSIRWQINVERNTRQTLFSSDDRYLFTVPGDGWARKINTADGAEVWRQFVGGFAYTNGLNVTPDEKYLCTQTKSGDLTLLNASDGSIIRQKNYGAWAGSCTFSADGKTLFASSGNSGGDVFDVETGKELLYRNVLGGYPPPRMNSDNSWILASPNPNSGIYDAQGNQVVQFATRDQQTIRIAYVGWINPDETRYVFAGTQMGNISSDVDVLQVFSIHIVPVK